MFENYYDLLNIPQTNDITLIKKGYKSQIKKYHPDKNTDKDKNTIEIFLKIQKAYEILINENKRKEYNIKLEKLKEKKNYSKERKKLIEELNKKEKEGKVNKDILNKKINRFEDSLSSIYFNNFNNKKLKKDEYLKIIFKKENKLFVNKDLIKNYFKSFVLIKEIIYDNTEDVYYMKIISNNNLDNILIQLKNDYTINKLFFIEKIDYKKFNNKEFINDEKLNFQLNKENEIIKNEKLLNKNIDYNNISLEEFENLVFNK